MGSKTPDFEPFGFVPDEDDGEKEDFRVRDLITKLVNETVRDFRLREKEHAFELLTAERIAQRVSQGKVGRAREEAQQVDLEEAVGAALQAFVDGLYLLFVDDIRKAALDEPVLLNLHTRVRLIRLTALSGAWRL